MTEDISRETAEAKQPNTETEAVEAQTPTPPETPETPEAPTPEVPTPEAPQETAPETTSEVTQEATMDTTESPVIEETPAPLPATDEVEADLQQELNAAFSGNEEAAGETKSETGTMERLMANLEKQKQETPEEKPAESTVDQVQAVAQSLTENAKDMAAMADMEKEADDALNAALNSALSDEPAGGEEKPEANVQLQMVRGRISAVSGDDVFVEVSGMAGMQGILASTQFDRPPRVGSIMDFIVSKVDETEGLVHLSREGAVVHATWEQLNKGDNVEVRVTGHNKGGLELALVGNIRGFMPASQIDLNHIEDFSGFVGQKLNAKVHDVDRKKRQVVVSRRAYLSAERKRLAAEKWETLALDQMVDGKVVSLMDYGAFVDIGGIEGLLHVSDMSYDRVNRPGDVVKVGDELNLKIIKLDKEKNRIGLGLKQAAPDPWDTFAAQITVGQEMDGKVVRLADFGAFVQLTEGVDALLPVSELAWNRVRHPKDVLSVGDEIRVRVMEVKIPKRRLSVSLKSMQENPWTGAETRFPEDGVFEGKILRLTDTSAFVEMAPGIDGMIHVSELCDRRIKHPGDAVKVGQVHKFRVLEIDEGRQRARLSLSQVRNPKPKRNKGPVKKEHVPSEYTATAKPKDKGNLTGGMGKSSAMGMGLGDLKL